MWRNASVLLCAALFGLLLAGGCPGSNSTNGGDDNTSGGSSNGNGDGDGNADGNGDPNGGGGDAALVIRSLAPTSDGDQLYITGVFGNQPGIVHLAGTTLNIVSWQLFGGDVQQVICDLPEDLFGDVQVQVGSRFSNVAQLSKFEIDLVSETMIPAVPPSTGMHNIKISAHFVIRACLNDLLDSGTFTALGAVSRGSTADIDASGTITNNPPPATYTSHEIVFFKQMPQNFRVVFPGDAFDPDVDRFLISVTSCNLRRGAGGGLYMQFTVSGWHGINQLLDGNSDIGQRATELAANQYFNTAAPVLFPFSGGGFNIADGQADAIDDPLFSKLMWSGSVSAPPED